MAVTVASVVALGGVFSHCVDPFDGGTLILYVVACLASEILFIKLICFELITIVLILFCVSFHLTTFGCILLNLLSTFFSGAIIVFEFSIACSAT